VNLPASEMAEALKNPLVSAAAVEARRSLIDAILVYPGARRGETTIELRGGLAAFLRLDGAAPNFAIRPGPTTVIAREVARSGSGEVMGTLVAGTSLSRDRHNLAVAI
jgi:hypothetical protein